MTNSQRTGQPTSSALSGKQIARATLLLVAGMVLSRLLGLARESVLASIFGAGLDYEAYLVAATPPETLYFVIAGGALGSAFIPTFATYLQKEKKREAWHIASSVLTIFTIILGVLSLLFALFALPIIRTILAPDFSPEQQILSAHLMQIMMITPIIFCISGLFMGMLNTFQRFLLPALAPAFYNIGIILGALFLAPTMGVYGLAWGVVGGALLHLLIQIPGIIRLRPAIKPAIDFRHPGVSEVFHLMLPRVLGLAIVQINFWVNITLATGMLPGSTAALKRAWMIFMLPQGVIAQSAANAAFPTFAIHSAKGDQDQMRTSLSKLLKSVLFLAIPATVGLIILRLPIVKILLEYNEFTSVDSQATAWALLFYSLGLIAHSLVEIVTRAFYAMHDTRTPVLIGGIAMLVNIGLSLVFVRIIGDPGNLTRGPFAGLALANTLATTLEGIVLYFIIRKRTNGLEDRQLLLSSGKALIASLLMGGAIVLASRMTMEMGLYLRTGLLAGLGTGVFFLTALMMKSEEMLILKGLILSKLRRRST